MEAAKRCETGGREAVDAVPCRHAEVPAELQRRHGLISASRVDSGAALEPSPSVTAAVAYDHGATTAAHAHPLTPRSTLTLLLALMQQQQCVALALQGSLPAGLQLIALLDSPH